MPLDKPNPLYVLQHCLEQEENPLWVLPLEETVYEGARQNGKRPAYFKMFVFDDMAKNIFGKPALRDEYYLVRVPRRIMDELAQSGNDPTQIENDDNAGVAD